MKKVVVIGGGPAGMIAAGTCASNGNEVILIEKNNKLGKKLRITGKGRCNITNASDIDIIFNNIITNQKFLYSALYTYTNDNVIQFFNDLGVETKVERGNRVFPVSDKASDVVNALINYLHKNKVKVITKCRVKSILINDKKHIQGVKTEERIINCDAVIVATGGISYSVTGSTGDGYTFAKNLGHNVIKATPSLVPLNVKEYWIKQLQGLSLRNVNMTITSDDKNVYEDFGEMLFTHFGVSGPIILSASSNIKKYINGSNLKLHLDLKPALDFNKLDKRILRDFTDNINKDFKNSLDKLLPKKLIPIIIQLSNISPLKKVNEITKEERQRLVSLIKDFQCTITGTRNIDEAIVTSGGIDVNEIDPATMQSKKINELYFAGEVVDVDALTGGYNLQIAFSTGYLAGISI